QGQYGDTDTSHGIGHGYQWHVSREISGAIQHDEAKAKARSSSSKMRFCWRRVYAAFLIARPPSRRTRRFAAPVSKRIVASSARIGRTRCPPLTKLSG